MSASHRRLVSTFLAAALMACGTPPSATDAAPPVVTLVSGGAQQRLLGLPLASPIRVRVVGEDGNPLPAVQVRAQTTTAFAVVEPVIGVTDADGSLDFAWRTGAQLGTQQVALSLPGYPDAAPLTVTATATSTSLLDVDGGGTILCGIWPTGELGCWSPLVSATDEPTVTRAADGGPFRELALHLTLPGSAHGCAATVTGRLWCFDVAPGGTISGMRQLAGGYPALHGLTTGIDSDAMVPPFCGLAIDGAAWCWGSNADGALGDGTFTDRGSPTRVLTSLRFQQLATGARHSCGLALDNAAWCWGANESGQLGRPTSESSQAGPRQVDPNFRFRALRVMGPDVSCGLGVGGGLRCWGNKRRMGLGILADSVPGPAVIRPTPPRGVLQAVSFAAIDSAIMAVESDGRGSWWGVLPVATQVLRADEPRPFDRLLPFAEFTVPASRGLVCGRPTGASSTMCVRVGVLTGFDFAAPNPSLVTIGMPT